MNENKEKPVNEWFPVRTDEEQAEHKEQQRKTAEVPMQTMGVEQLPMERPIKYNEVTAMIGHLYLDCHQRVKLVEEQAQALLENAMQQVKALQQENMGLRKQLEMLIQNERNTQGQDVSDNDG